MSSTIAENCVLAQQQSTRPAAAKKGEGGDGESSGADSFFIAFAGAWGRALDAQAAKITGMSNGLEAAIGEDKLSAITLLTAESLKMSFLAQSAHTAVTSLGSALETSARKQ